MAASDSVDGRDWEISEEMIPVIAKYLRSNYLDSQNRATAITRCLPEHSKYLAWRAVSKFKDPISRILV
jgi:hypothetical protein